MKTNTIGTAQTAKPRTAPTWRQRARTIALWALVIVVALTSALLVAGQAAKARLQAQHPPIGTLIDVGGYRMHLRCQGSGSPTVILEAGGGEPGLDWSLVQPAIAPQTRVCAYDRAGLGWSDPSPRPRTATVMAEELHTLLHRAGVDGPYVLVGHSLGGMIVRQYAVAHPHDVVGMVLVDSATEQQAARFPAAVRSLTSSTLVPRLVSVAADLGLLALYPGIFPLLEQLPADTAATYQALTISSGKAIKTALAEVADTDADLTPRPASLGAIPLVVLRHGRSVLPLQGPITPQVAQEYEAIWAQMQLELAGLSPRGRVVVAEGSGHGVQFDRPDLVIAAIREVLQG